MTKGCITLRHLSKAADFIRGGPDAAAQTASDSAIKTAQDYVTQPAVSDPTAQLGQGPQGLTGKEYFQASPEQQALALKNLIKIFLLIRRLIQARLIYSGQLAEPERGYARLVSRRFGPHC
jgi:hypothetical protein